LEDYRKALQGQRLQPQQPVGEVTTITPDQAISAGGMPAGPTVARANLIGQQVRMPAPQMSQQDMLYQDAMNKYMIAERSGYPDIAAKYLESALKIKPREEVTGDIFKTASGEYVQRTKSGQFIPVSGQFAPIEKPMGAPIKVKIEVKNFVLKVTANGQSMSLDAKAKYKNSKGYFKFGIYATSENKGNYAIDVIEWPVIKH